MIHNQDPIYKNNLFIDIITRFASLSRQIPQSISQQSEIDFDDGTECDCMDDEEEEDAFDNEINSLSHKLDHLNFSIMETCMYHLFKSEMDCYNTIKSIMPDYKPKDDDFDAKCVQYWEYEIPKNRKERYLEIELFKLKNDISQLQCL